MGASGYPNCDLIMKYDNGSWSYQTFNPCQSYGGIYAIDMLSENEGWAAAGQWIYRYSYGNWSTTEPGSNNFRGVDALSSDNVWAVDSYRIYNWDGISWNLYYSGEDGPDAIAMCDENTGFAIKRNGTIYEGLMMRWNGNEWVIEAPKVFDAKPTDLCWVPDWTGPTPVPTPTPSYGEAWVVGIKIDETGTSILKWTDDRLVRVPGELVTMSGSKELMPSLQIVPGRWERRRAPHSSTNGTEAPASGDRIAGEKVAYFN